MLLCGRVCYTDMISEHFYTRNKGIQLMRIGLVELLLILTIASLAVGPQVALFVDRWMRRANRASAKAARRRAEQEAQRAIEREAVLQRFQKLSIIFALAAAAARAKMMLSFWNRWSTASRSMARWASCSARRRAALALARLARRIHRSTNRATCGPTARDAMVRMSNNSTSPIRISWIPLFRV